MIVDASAIVDYLLDHGPRGTWSTSRIRTVGMLHAPHLLDVEVLATLRRIEQASRVESGAVGRAVDDFLALRVRRYPIAHLLPRIWELRHSITASDAAYVVLAETLRLPLLTTDDRLARSHGHRAEILSFAR